MKKAGIVILVITVACAFAKAQMIDPLLKNDSIIAELDSLLMNQEDSLSLFRLIDSLITAPGGVDDQSQLALRLGYNSNATATSRALGINQLGLSPGLSFYHKSGIYADVTGYWSSEYEPNFYLTVLSGGYMKTFDKHWTLLSEYSHYFYFEQSDVVVPYTNNIGVSNFFEFGRFNFRLDYSFLFGDKTAHRITPGVFVNFEKRDWHGLRRIAFFPSANLLLGSEVVTTYSAENRPYTDNPLLILFRVRHGLPLTYTYYKENNNREFGVMNYSLSAPISVATKHWTFLVSYTYNFPQALKGEMLSTGDGGYLSASITRYLNFD